MTQISVLPQKGIHMFSLKIQFTICVIRCSSRKACRSPHYSQETATHAGVRQVAPFVCPVFIDLAFILPGCPLTFELWRRRPGQDAELVHGCCVPSFFLIRDPIKGQSVTTLQRCLCRSVKTSALNADTQNLETIRERRLDLNCPVVTLSPDVQCAWRDLILLLIFNPVTFNPPKSIGLILEAL